VIGDTASCRLRLFYGIDGHTDARDYRRIVSDLRTRRVAGVLLASAPHRIADTPIMTEPGVPRVALMNPAHAPPGLSVVAFSHRAYIRAVLDYAVAQGRRRVAVLTVPAHATAWERALAERAKDGQVETCPHWVQCVAPEYASSARPLIRLLMHAEQRVRPDALVITDDNLVEQATRGLTDLGIDVPSQLLVTAHANFPLPSDAHVPVRRIGYDAGRVLDICIGELNRQRREGGARRIRVCAQWEEDLAPTPAHLPATPGNAS
jgi:DNA-binding LacI/PurR family transcriptional regulator